MGPGFVGRFMTVIVFVLAVPFPQELLAVTEMFPPEAPTVAVMEVVVEVPVQPEGNDQVYEVAPETADMLNV